MTIAAVDGISVIDTISEVVTARGGEADLDARLDAIDVLLNPLKLVQFQSFQTGAVASGTGTITDDDSIPQNTEGNQFMSLSITPLNSSNILLIQVVINLHSTLGGNVQVIAALFKDSIADAIACASYANDSVSGNHSLFFSHREVAGSTSLITFKVRAGGESAGTTTRNGVSGSRKFGGVLQSSIRILEFRP